MYFGFQNISIKYGKKRVIENLSADFPKGKIVTIIGKNGCGKSSLLKTVSRAVRPDTGAVIYEDRPLNSYKPKFAARKIAYLPQVRDSPPDIDVKTLVSYGRYPHIRFGRGMTRADADTVDRALRLTGLAHLKYQTLATLSGGERQRAWIAMTICQEPEILILDEPTTYLDVGYQLDILELIGDLNKTLGLTIIMVLHDLNMAARYSDLLYAVKDCTICSGGRPCDMITKPELARVFQIDAEIVHDARNHCPYFIPIKTKNTLQGEVIYETH